MSNGTPIITLYSSPISNCAARLRIALNLKGLSYTCHTINMSKGEHLKRGFLAVNPAGSIPSLVVHYDDPSTFSESNPEVRVGQSVAALEFLDEAFPETYQLLPKDEPHIRAKVRSLVGILASDTHPLLTFQVKQNIRDSFPGADTDRDMSAWYLNCVTKGLEKFENAVKESSGKYSVGDEITMADVVLVPEVWFAQKIGVDLEQYPTVKRMFESMCALEDVKKEETVRAEL